MNKERERIIFLHDIPGGLDDENDVAKQLSKNHPELVIFSDPKPLTDPQVKRELMENSDANVYGPQEFFAGAHIYKNGVKYSLVRGISPYKDSVTIGNHIISLKLDKYGFLRLERYPVISGYFYVGPYNPLTNGYLINITINGIESDEYDVLIDSETQLPVIPHYNSVKDIFTEENVENTDIYGFTRTFDIVGYDEVSTTIKPAYVLMPKSYEDKLLLSNSTSFGEAPALNPKYVFELLTDPNFVIENIIIEGVDYLLIRTIADCDKITIYYNN